MKIFNFGKRETVYIYGMKRPLDATPEAALQLSKTMKVKEIAKLWKLSRQRVYQLIKKAKGK